MTVLTPQPHQFTKRDLRKASAYIALALAISLLLLTLVRVSEDYPDAEGYPDAGVVFLLLVSGAFLALLAAGALMALRRGKTTLLTVMWGIVAGVMIAPGLRSFGELSESNEPALLLVVVVALTAAGALAMVVGAAEGVRGMRRDVTVTCAAVAVLAALGSSLVQLTMAPSFRAISYTNMLEQGLLSALLLFAAFVALRSRGTKLLLAAWAVVLGTSLNAVGRYAEAGGGAHGWGVSILLIHLGVALLGLLLALWSGGRGNPEPAPSAL